MSNVKHTPAPWHKDDGMLMIEDQINILKENIDTEREWTMVVLREEEGEHATAVVAICHPDNAPLIASAPELLEILENIREYAQLNLSGDIPKSVQSFLIGEATEGIKKAKGE